MTPAPAPPKLGREPLEEDDDGASLVTRFGTVIGGGVVAAVLASVPAEMRMSENDSMLHALPQWLVLAALMTPLGILCVTIFRRARVGLRLLAGEHVALVVAGVLWWCVLELGLLSVFGGVLRAKTHHHGLAGVTFAIFAVVSGIAVAMLAARGMRALRDLHSPFRRVVLGVAGVAAFLSLVLVGVRTGRAPQLHTAAALVDVLALGVVSTIVSARSFARLRPFAIAGVPLAAVVLFVGLSLFHTNTELRQEVRQSAPVHAWVADAILPEPR